MLRYLIVVCRDMGRANHIPLETVRGRKQGPRPEALISLHDPCMILAWSFRYPVRFDSICLTIILMIESSPLMFMIIVCWKQYAFVCICIELNHFSAQFNVWMNKKHIGHPYTRLMSMIIVRCKQYGWRKEFGHLFFSTFWGTFSPLFSTQNLTWCSWSLSVGSNMCGGRKAQGRHNTSTIPVVAFWRKKKVLFPLSLKKKELAKKKKIEKIVEEGSSWET